MRRALATLAAVHLLAACSEKPAAPEPARPEETTPAPPAPSPQALPPPEGASGGLAVAPSPAPVVPPAPAAAPARAATRPPAGGRAPTAAPAPPPVAAEHAAVGSDRCKICHRVQHSSWAASAHPAKGVDCEFCHGPGSDYVSIKIMKDPVAARAAGLVVPRKERCLPCHASKWSDDMLGRAHAHRSK